MNEQKARQNGLVFTGYYDRDLEKINTQIAKLRKEYPDCKFCKVTVPLNPLSKGYGGSGYSIYATRLYHILQSIEYVEKDITRHKATVQRIKDEYIKALATEADKHKENLARLKTLQEEKQELLKK